MLNFFGMRLVVWHPNEDFLVCIPCDFWTCSRWWDLLSSSSSMWINLIDNFFWASLGTFLHLRCNNNFVFSNSHSVHVKVGQSYIDAIILPWWIAIWLKSLARCAIDFFHIPWPKFRKMVRWLNYWALLNKSPSVQIHLMNQKGFETIWAICWGNPPSFIT